MSKYELATRETLLRLADERDRYKKALEEISEAPMSEAYKGCEALGKTYQGLSFGNLQQIAKEALGKSKH